MNHDEPEEILEPGQRIIDAHHLRAVYLLEPRNRRDARSGEQAPVRADLNQIVANMQAEVEVTVSIS